MWRNRKLQPRYAGEPILKVVARPHYLFDSCDDLPMISIREHTGDVAQKILIQYFSLVLLNFEKDE